MRGYSGQWVSMSFVGWTTNILSWGWWIKETHHLIQQTYPKTTPHTPKPITTTPHRPSVTITSSNAASLTAYQWLYC